MNKEKEKTDDMKTMSRKKAQQPAQSNGDAGADNHIHSEALDDSDRHLENRS